MVLGGTVFRVTATAFGATVFRVTVFVPMVLEAVLEAATEKTHVVPYLNSSA